MSRRVRTVVVGMPAALLAGLLMPASAVAGTRHTVRRVGVPAVGGLEFVGSGGGAGSRRMAPTSSSMPTSPVPGPRGRTYLPGRARFVAAYKAELERLEA
jgi:hypothetical protein